MRCSTRFAVLLGMSSIVLCPLIYGQNDRPAGLQAAPASPPATEEEVAQLRQEVAELKALILRLAPAGSVGNPVQARLVQASAVAEPIGNTLPEMASASDVHALQKEVGEIQKKNSETPPA